MSCASKRIRRSSHFYIGGNNQYFWCNQCNNELDNKTPIELIDLTVAKADLKKKKNDEVHEESWVQCDVCEKWIHQICGLFNTRQNKEHHSEYCCPLCLLDKRKDKPFTTFVYHEILIAYLDYARQRGFVTAHIWACLPLNVHDSIFYAKPEDQKTPRDSRLRQWYIDMLTDSQKRDIGGKVTNMYDLYFTNLLILLRFLIMRVTIFLAKLKIL
jgi:hypothetical protein